MATTGRTNSLSRSTRKTQKTQKTRRSVTHAAGAYHQTGHRRFFDVYKEFGFGFLEGSYANALAVELRSKGLSVRREVPIEVVYRGVPVGMYRVDLIVEESVLVEVKSTKTVSDADFRQVLNYLKATDLEVGFLLHFGPKPRFRRLIYTNDRK